MYLTIDEQERQAIWAGNTAMAIALGRIIDLEQERLRLRDLVREAQDYVQDADWDARAQAALED